MYRLTPWLQAGVEYNPLGDDVGPLVNLRAIEETRRRPALILGTSSDRIGTEDGRAVYATLSKDLEHLIGWSVAPYVGVAHVLDPARGEDDWREVAGLNFRWGQRLSSAHLWDGENLHHVLTTSLGEPEAGRTVGVVVAERDDGEHFLGVTFGASFAGPWRAGGLGEQTAGHGPPPAR